VPYITGDTLSAESSIFFVSGSFSIPGIPTGGTLSVAVDDMAVIYVNGSLVGKWGSVTELSKASMAANILNSFDIGPYLVSGVNTLTIKVLNGPASFPGNCAGNCTYAQNPAGVVFGGSIRYENASEKADDLSVSDASDVTFQIRR